MHIQNLTAPRLRFSPWSAGALVIAVLVVTPLASVLWIALTPRDNIWPHLLATTLPRYLGNSLILMASVAVMVAVTGTVTAWLVTMYRFPGRRWLEWLLLLPLAIPAYIGAYAITDLLEYAGPVQSGLRTLFGWADARAYWFPEVRSRETASVVLAAALYPYVYLLARAAFLEQSVSAFDVARTLGAGPWRRFLRVGLPLARPAIAVGTAIAMMETVSDFGVVQYFAVQTLTTGIFTTWLEAGNAGGAAQIALVVMAIVLGLVALEKNSRRRSRFYQMSRQQRPTERITLTGWRAWMASFLCALPVAIGFVLPAGVITVLAVRNTAEWSDPRLLQTLWNTLFVSGVAAAVTVTAALFLVYGVRLSGRLLPRALLPVTTLGYAAPGAVLGLGLLLPMAWADHRIADAIEAVFGVDPGLLMTGTTFAIIVAYVVRFFAIAQGAADSAFGRVSPNLPLAARSLGRSAGGTLRRIHLPLISGSIGTALLLVFVDAVKELPATLLLRPFNFDTLATRVYDQASLERISAAAPPALMVILVGLTAVLILARSLK
ncbi:iron ABC transporter permease [Pseudoruegeria sp. SK021]|uniref:ABC transporter permease n=1 Tax=Pseudoruegeria sp. SK021 TaxID=1933035 RepID=UPI000A215EF0|nr:iron ABC transporter permease [Pseudoruegeria sp. SK021]OSP56133.1 iron ABC transporter permease [Pseudoruegeria sp. SK021]